MSKVKLALGAASLFLFIVGVKRSFPAEEAGLDAASSNGAGEPRPGRPRRRKRRDDSGEQTAAD